jgi:hypothetical protein
MLPLLALLLSVTPAPLVALQDNQSARLVVVGSNKLFLNCTGDGSGPAVILEAGTGDTSEVWNAVQKQVDKSARLCTRMKSSAIYINFCTPRQCLHPM